MLPSPLPQWLREQIVDVIIAYRTTIQLCEERVAKLTEEGVTGDECGEMADYQMLAKYCAGTATRLPLLILESLTRVEISAIVMVLQATLPMGELKPDQMRNLREEMELLEWSEDERKKQYREVMVNPQTLAAWAWLRPLKPKEPTPEPEEAVPEWRVNELLQPLTQRQAEAFILTKVCLLSAARAGEIMGCSEGRVRILVHQAKESLKVQALLRRAD